MKTLLRERSSALVFAGQLVIGGVNFCFFPLSLLIFCVRKKGGMTLHHVALKASVSGWVVHFNAQERLDIDIAWSD
jgi:hypothetical protein